jgi:hypothetical protein
MWKIPAKENTGVVIGFPTLREALNYCAFNSISETLIVEADTSREFLALKASLRALIEGMANSIYLAIVPSPGLLKEYMTAEEETVSWIANQEGEPPPKSLESWATAAKISNAAAASTIVGEADKLRTFMQKVREIRLSGKEAIERSLNRTEAQTIAATCVSNLKKLAGVP